jgi:hypothetical protein
MESLRVHAVQMGANRCSAVNGCLPGAASDLAASLHLVPEWCEHAGQVSQAISIGQVIQVIQGGAPQAPQLSPILCSGSKALQL